MFRAMKCAFFILLLSPLVTSHYEHDCPSACVCVNITVVGKSQPGVRANCDKSRFIKIPSASEFPNLTYEVDLSENDLTKIHVLDTMEELTFLDLSINEIDDIIPYAFAGLKSLRVLDLSNNQLEELPAEAFDNLTTLRVLNLSHNSLRSLDDELFLPLQSLQELHLSYNPLVHVNAPVMKPLKSLSILGLNAIGAYTLKADNFHYNTKLSELRLSENKFAKVPNEGLRSALNLRKLYLNENKIREINEESFAGLSTLEELYVSHCDSLTDIKKESFSDLRNVRIISITSNPVLSYIDPFAFHRTFNATNFKLEELYLNENSLSTLVGPSYYWCRLKVLDLRGNHWNCDCNLRWIKDCPNESILVAGVRCQSPTKLRSYDVAMIDADAFNCPLNTEREMKVFRLMVIVLGSIMLLFLTALLAALIKRDNIARWWRERSRRNGAIYYVKARTAPTDSVEF